MEGSEVRSESGNRDGSVMKNDLQKYLSETIERLMADAIKATLNNPRESLFLLSFAAASRRAAASDRADAPMVALVLFRAWSRMP